MLSQPRDDSSASSRLDAHSDDAASISELLERLRDRVRTLNPQDLDPLDLSIDNEAAWNERKHHFMESLRVRTSDRIPAMIGEGVVCLQCEGDACHHRLPKRVDEVFERYTPNGKPIFTSFADAVLREKPQLSDQLFVRSSELIAYTSKHPQVVDPLLPSVAARSTMKLLGVAKIGYVYSAAFESDERRAVSILLWETSTRFELQLVGLHDLLYQTIRRLPDDDHLRVILKALRNARHRLKRLMRQRRAKISDQEMSPLSVLGQLAAALRRATGKGKSRTQHAKKRHAQGDRPTGQAFKDARQVALSSFFFDERRKTYVVLGRRGRAHLFSAKGKHVTSIRLEKGEAERKQNSGRWRPTSRADYEQFKAVIASA